MSLVIKRNDTGQVFSSALTVNGSPFDLTGWTVNIIISSPTLNIKRKAEATITDAGGGLVEYLPSAQDVKISGDYQIEWEATNDGSGRILTFPSGSYERLTIKDDLG